MVTLEKNNSTLEVRSTKKRAEKLDKMAKEIIAKAEKAEGYRKTSPFTSNTFKVGLYDIKVKEAKAILENCNVSYSSDYCKGTTNKGIVTNRSKDNESWKENAEGYILSSSLMNWFYELYLASEQERNDWRVSPILAEDLSNLPPCYIVTILSDILRDEGRDYVSKLKEAGNNVQHIEYDNAVHGFISWPLDIKITKKAIEDISKSVKKILS